MKIKRFTREYWEAHKVSTIIFLLFDLIMLLSLLVIPSIFIVIFAASSIIIHMVIFNRLQQMSTVLYGD